MNEQTEIQLTTHTAIPTSTDIAGPNSTAVPTTDVPTTDVPTTAVPTTDVPTTDVPTTDVPTTAVPTTDVPTTDVPIDVHTSISNETPISMTRILEIPGLLGMADLYLNHDC